MDTDLTRVRSRLQDVLERASSGAPAPRAELEDALTDGYAGALELDAECRRLENRIAEIATAFAAGNPVPETGDLRVLAHRLTAGKEELAKLREFLAEVRAQGYAHAGSCAET